jgi:hypothetical protein
MNEPDEHEESREQDRVLELAAVLMEGLARSFREMMQKPTKPSSSRPAKGPHVGQRVRIVRQDAYHQMTGELLGRRGTMFWYIWLDATDCQVERVIYKNADGFTSISD